MPFARGRGEDGGHWMPCVKRDELAPCVRPPGLKVALFRFQVRSVFVAFDISETRHGQVLAADS